LLLVEARQVLVAERDPGLELLRRDADEREAHALVVELVAFLELGVGHLDAVGGKRFETLEEELAVHVALELAAVALLLEEGLEPGAVEGAVLLQLGHLRDGEQDLVLARRDAETGGLVLEQRGGDQLVERLPG